MSKDSAHSRIPRLDNVGSRIRMPRNFRIPNTTPRLPTKRGPPQTPAPSIGFLRPPSQVRSGPISIARSYSGDKLSYVEPSPFPLLTASTPAPAHLRFGVAGLKSVGPAATTERLEDIILCRREFAIPSDDDEDDVQGIDEVVYGPEATLQMLVDESLELVGANSTDNLLDPPPTEPASREENTTVVIVGRSAPSYARNEHTVTLQRDGNVTYEIRRSGTFVKSSRESLNSPQDLPRPSVMNQTHTRAQTSCPSFGPAGGLVMTQTFRRESSESIDSPVLDFTRNLTYRRPSTGELMLEETTHSRPPILNSTMVNERLLNITQSIPNITQELLYGDAGHEPCLAPGDSVLNRTTSVEGRCGGLDAQDKPKSNRLTFNMDESLNQMQFSKIGSGSRHGCEQVFNSTQVRSESIAIPITGGGSLKQLAGSENNATMLLMDASASDRTLVPADARSFDQRDTSVDEDMSAGKETFDMSLDEPEPCDLDDHPQPEVVLRRHLENRSNTVPAPKQRYSFGLDLTDCTLDCSIELCDSSLLLAKPAHLKSPTSSLTNQGSFEMDESLGILTPDQMKEFLDSTTTNTNTNNTNNANAAGLELQLNTGVGVGAEAGSGHHHHKHGALQHHCRIDQTPSPEELPLDPVGVKTDMSDIMLPAELLLMAGGPQPYGGVGGVGVGPGSVGATGGASELSQADSDPKTDQMTKSATSSKVSNSFITSITSITSLDTGYQGDGEMSRPASRGADHSPSNGPRIKSALGGGAWQPMMAAAVAAVPRRQDPMTDSDFFTESDADDVFNRGDARRAQIIDGQLYGAGGAGGAPGANAIFNAIDEQDDQDVQGQQEQQQNQQLHQDAGQNEDSCMESSGIFTDVENRADDDLVQRRADDQQQAADAAAAVVGGGRCSFEGEQHRADDMSPDVSTDTISSSNSQNFVRASESQVHVDHGPNVSLDVFENTVAGGNTLPRGRDDDDDSNLSHRGASEKANEHHYQATGDGDVGAAGSPTTAGVASPGSGDAVAGSAAHRCDADSFPDGSGKRSVACSSNNSSSSSTSSSNNGNSGSAIPKQLKNEANRGLRKHHQHAVVGDMSTTSSVSRAERMSKTRSFKDSPVGVPRGGAGCAEQCAGDGGDCDQENKRPGAVGGTRTVGASASVRGGSTGSNLSFVKKSNTPNKWDAVMSKIAENKSVMRRNFSDVKSRVSCGSGAGVPKGASSVALLRRDSPATATLKSPPSECTSVTSRSSAHGKRTISGSTKRGRTHSKDSQQSSLSDLSLSGGSPKLTLKVSNTRPAKKRDVRTINSSSSDLGPPSKTNGAQPTRSSAARAAAALQKRISPNLTNASIPLVPEQLKASPPSKRNVLLKRNGTANGSLPAKTPLKGKLAARLHKDKEANKENSINGDHNRLAGATSKTSSAAAVTNNNTSAKPLAKSLIRSSTVSNASPTTATNHQPSAQHLPNHHSQHTTSNGSSGGVATTATTTVKAIQRNGTIILDKSSSPLLICHATAPSVGDEPVTTSTDGGDVRSSAPSLEEPSQRPVQSKTTIPSSCEPNCDQLHQHQPRDRVTGTDGKGPELVDISLLNHAQKGVEALGVLVQYLVFNLDAFSCPTIKAAHQKTTTDLLETKSILNDERNNSTALKQQLLETTERETELQKLHRCELSRVETCLSEQQQSADERIAALEAELMEKESYSRQLLSRIDDYSAKLSEHEKQLENAQSRELDLLQRINTLSCTENELRDKVHSSELAFSKRLQAAAMRERDLTEQINGLNRDLERMRRDTEQKERELEEKLSITKDECVVLRQSRHGSVEPVCQNGTSLPAAAAIPLQLNRSSGSINHLQVLQDEVDSLRCVLDLKQREISELRKQTQEYERDAKELPSALMKISALDSRIEDLEVQLKTKTEEEKDLQQKLKHLQDNLTQETKIKSRLSLHNEELQWRLKQNSEKFTLAYAELSKSYHENSSFMMNATKTSLDQMTPGNHHGQHHHHQLSHNHSRSSCSERMFDMDDISPQTSQVIKGMVEKSDSVSWVLEIDDEPPEVSASRIVRRAGSLRSSAAYDSVAKRPKCAGLSQTVNGVMSSPTAHGGIQQSASAASILKQHSSDIKPPHSGSSSSHRLRSKSVSIKAAEPPKKIVRSNSGTSGSPCPAGMSRVPCKLMRMMEMAGSWKEQPLYSSSPIASKRYLNEDMDLVASGSDKPCEQQPKDLFLEETEFLSEPESPFARRPKLNGVDIANPPIEIFHRDKTPNFKKSKENRGLITCDTAALTGGTSAKATSSGLSSREIRRANFAALGAMAKDAAGKALRSGSNSDDEVSFTSSASSSSCISEGSLSDPSGSSSSSHGNSPLHGGKRSSGRMNEDDTVEGDGDSSKEEQPAQHRRRHSNISLEDALMKKIVASLNGDNPDGNDTPMEVSWSEDGDPGSESIV